MKRSTATKAAILAFLIVGVCSAVLAGNLIDLAHQVKGVLASSSLPGPFNAMLAPSSVTPPACGSFTWGNQGSATCTANTGGALVLTAPGNSASFNINYLYKTAPATPWTVTAGYVMLPQFTAGSVQDFTFTGLALRESATGKIEQYSLASGSGSLHFYLQAFTNYTSLDGAVVDTSFGILPPILWVQLSDNGTNITFKISQDGQNFQQIYTQARAAHFTTAPDQVGMFVNSYDSTTQTVFVHWSGV